MLFLKQQHFSHYRQIFKLKKDLNFVAVGNIYEGEAKAGSRTT